MIAKQQQDYAALELSVVCFLHFVEKVTMTHRQKKKDRLSLFPPFKVGLYGIQVENQKRAP